MAFYSDNAETLFWNYLFGFFFKFVINKCQKKRGGVIANCVLACSNTCNGILSTMKRSNVGQHAQGQRKKPVLFKYLKKNKNERFSILTSKIAHRLLVVSDKIDIQITGKLSQLVKNSSSGVLLNTGKQLSDPMRFAYVQRTLAVANLD